MIYSIVSIAFGAIIGALLRWRLSEWLNHSATLPIGTLVANLLGAYGIGLAAAYFAQHSAMPIQWRLFIITGMMGSLTTFSTFSLETLTMVQEGKWGMAFFNAAIHLGGSLVMTFLGLLTIYGTKAG